MWKNISYSLRKLYGDTKWKILSIIYHEKVENNAQVSLAKLKKQYSVSCKGAEHFYVIFREAKTVGIFSNVFVFMNQISYALENGMIPVIDMLHFENSILPDSLLNRQCAWSAFFEQPCSCNLEDIKGKNVSFSNGNFPPDGNYPHFSTAEDYSKNRQSFLYWKSFYHKYIVFNRETQEYLSVTAKQVLPAHSKILGVKVRAPTMPNFPPRAT